MIIKYIPSIVSNGIKHGLLRKIGYFTPPQTQYCSMPEGKTAAILTIGDEILQGTTDVNTPFLIKELNDLNVKIQKVAIVPDNVNVITEEIFNLSSKCSFVLTSGGTGPTHDDVTYEAIAKAFNDVLHLNEDLMKLFMNYFGPDARKNPGVIKFCHIPKSAVLNYINLKHNNKEIRYPVVSINNVYIFPGVPILLRKSFNGFKSRFAVKNTKFFKNIYIDIDEFSIIETLNKAVKIFKNVKFGSYPTFTHNYYKVKLSLESQSNEEIESAYRYFAHQLPCDSIVNIKKDLLLSAKDDVYSLCHTSPQVSSAISVLEKALKKFTLSELCVCFSGGKDGSVLLHLLYACVQNLKLNEWNKIRFLYVKSGDTFKEVELFIESTVHTYDMNLTILDGNLKQAVDHYLEMNTDVKAILLGTRKDDPGASNLETFCPTDSEWPSVIRVLPILSWSYTDIWFFIRNIQLPYCILYDKGYTSLGTKSKTIQNPSLLLETQKGFQSYKPAYMLQDTENERKSRL